MILVVVSCIAAVYAFRWYLVYGTRGDWGKKYGGVVASVVNFVQIQILNTVYKKIAVSLTGELVQQPCQFSISLSCADYH